MPFPGEGPGWGGQPVKSCLSLVAPAPIVVVVNWKLGQKP